MKMVEYWKEIKGKKVKIEQLPKEFIEITEEFIEFLKERIGVPFDYIEYTLSTGPTLGLQFSQPLEECYYALDEKRNILFVQLNRDRLIEIVEMSPPQCKLPNMFHFVFKYIALGVLMANSGKLHRKEPPSHLDKDQAIELAADFISLNARAKEKGLK